jgi:hypothetical protein
MFREGGGECKTAHLEGLRVVGPGSFINAEDDGYRDNGIASAPGDFPGCPRIWATRPASTPDQETPAACFRESPSMDPVCSSPRAPTLEAGLAAARAALAGCYIV